MVNATKRKWLTLALCIATVLLVLGILSFFAPIYGEICSKSEYTGEKECAPHNIAVFIILSVGNFLDYHEGAIVAIATIFIAVFTFNLRRSTDKLWLAGEEQIKIAKTASDAAKASADASLVALRPWLSCEVKAAGPLIFSKGDAVFKFNFIVTNVGHSPAMNVSFSPRITVLNSPDEQAIVWLKKMAEFNRGFPVKATTILLPGGENFGNEEIGLVLFPNESHPFNYILRIKRDEIEKSCKDLKLSKTSKYIMPIVCGLVTYNYPLAKVRADTGFVYPIRKASGKTKGAFYLNKSVPQNNIIFDTDFSGKGFAT